MKYLLFLFLITFSSNNLSSHKITIEHKGKKHKVNTEKKLNQFINNFFDFDIDIQKKLSSKIKYNETGQFYYIDIAAYDSNFNVKKIAIPLLSNDEKKSNSFKTIGCFHKCDFLETALPSHNYDWIITSPCKSQSCGNAYVCSITFL